MTVVRLVCTGLASLGLIVALTTAAQAQEQGDNVLLTPSDITWESRGATGVKIASLHGDPAQPGEPFTFRLILPDGFEMEPHTHPVAEHMTVMSGRFYVGIGEKMDRPAAREYGPGSYVVVAADVPAYMFAVGETVVQVHGFGPMTTTLVEQD